MAIEITIPRLGWSMDEGTFGEWLKRDGEFVAAGDPIFTLESEKALQEVESVDEGVLRILENGPAEGDTVTVGKLIAFLLADGEELPVVPDHATETAPTPTDSAPPLEPPAPTELQARESTASPPIQRQVPVARQAPPASPSVRRLAREMGVDLNRLRTDGRISEDTVLRARAGNGEPATIAPDVVVGATVIPRRNEYDSLPKISPRAERRARQLHIDWTRLRGTGRSGRIRERDVEAAAGPVEQQPTAEGTITPLHAVRRTIATRMSRSAQETAAVTLTSRVDCTRLVSLRAKMKAESAGAVVPGYNEILIQIVAAALKQHPELNRQWTPSGLLSPDGVNIGLAIDTDAGLMVPVIHDAGAMSLTDLTVRTHDLADRARRRCLQPDELRGGTFTITNLGAFGIDAFTPIINLPETAILGIGAIRREPVVGANDEIEIRDLMTLSLTFDHRVTDGAPAGRFLQSVCSQIVSG